MVTGKVAEIKMRTTRIRTRNHTYMVVPNKHIVDTVIVNGKILMEGRKVKSVNEAEVLALAQRETEEALRRTNLEHLLVLPKGFWGKPR